MQERSRRPRPPRAFPDAGRAAARACAIAAAVGACLCLEGCVGSQPVVRESGAGVVGPALGRVAVVPFYPGEELSRSAPAGGPAPWEVALFVTRQMTDALLARGVAVVPASDVETAFLAEGEIAPRLDPIATARVASQKFGARSVLLGRVLRYRPRDPRDPTGGASVAFEVTLYSSPAGQELWTGLFDERQPPLTASPQRAWRLPGGGTRWLTPSELAGWGAERVAEALVARR